jgi:hypothetical protein
MAYHFNKTLPMPEIQINSENPILHIELKEKFNVDLQLRGEPGVLIDMLVESMDRNPQVAAMFVAATYLWAQREGIPWDKIGAAVSRNIF